MIKTTGVKAAIANIKLELEKQKKVAKEHAKDKLVLALKAATPVDTGFARDSWRKTPDGIVNDAPYIQELNEGSSEQAPSHFIERTVLSQPNVVPNGSIVKYD